jgi:ribosomal protein L17
MATRNTPSRGSKPDKLMRDALRVALHREAIDADGKPTKRLNIIADRLVEAAMDGDMSAIREIFDRIDGKVVPADTTEPQGDVIYHINTGIVRPGDGPNGIMLNGRGRLIEGERAEAEDAETVDG